MRQTDIQTDRTTYTVRQTDIYTDRTTYTVQQTDIQTDRAERTTDTMRETRKGTQNSLPSFGTARKGMNTQGR